MNIKFHVTTACGRLLCQTRSLFCPDLVCGTVLIKFMLKHLRHVSKVVGTVGKRDYAQEKKSHPTLYQTFFPGYGRHEEMLGPAETSCRIKEALDVRLSVAHPAMLAPATCASSRFSPLPLARSPSPRGLPPPPPSPFALRIDPFSPSPFLRCPLRPVHAPRDGCTCSLREQWTSDGAGAATLHSGLSCLDGLRVWPDEEGAQCRSLP